MGCDGFITFKVFELVASVVCMIFKRVTDDEASRLGYYLQRQSKEWPLQGNVFWGNDGSIFADITYGGFAVVSLGLLIGQCTGELRNIKHTENFLLGMGGLMYFGAAGLELSVIDSVQPNLVDNAAILGVVSLVTGLVFIVDLLLGSKRRKMAPKQIRALGYDKNTQTEDTKQSNQTVVENGFKKVHPNAVKILPTSPPMDETMGYPKIPITNSHNEFVGTISPQVYSAQELKSPKVKIQSTDSFLRAEKGEMPVVRRAASPNDIFVPPGYILVPAKGVNTEVPTPPGYASVEPKRPETPRKLQSPTVTTTIKTPQGYYYSTESRDSSPIEDEHQTNGLSKDRLWSVEGKGRGYPDETFFPFRRNDLMRSSNKLMSDKYGRQDRNDLIYPVEVDDTSLDGHKIDEELRRIRHITKSDNDLTAEIAKENQALKQILRKEQEEKAKLKVELKKSDLEERKRLEDKVNELEEYQAKLEKELKEEERKKLEQKIKELEDEKDRRISEKDIQYFGISDLHHSKKESSPIIQPDVPEMEEMYKKGAKEINSKLKEKSVRRQREDDELRQVIEDGFHFLDEDERKKRSDKLMRDVEERRSLYNQRRHLELHETKSYDETPSRGATPGGTSFKSEAQMWVGVPPPLSPKDPGYVLHTAQNWPESSPASPTDRFRFSSKKANSSFKLTNSISPSPEYPERSSSGDGDDDERPLRRRGLLLRKVDFPDDPVTLEMERPATVTGGTSTWKKWLQPGVKNKLQPSRSMPH